MIFNLTNATFSGPVTQGENFTQYVNYNTMTSTITQVPTSEPPAPAQPATCLDMLELAEEPLHPNYLVIGLEQDRLQVKLTPKEIQTNEMAQKYLAVAEKSRTSPSCRYATYTFTATVSADGGDKELEFVQDAEMQGGDDDDKGEDGDTPASSKKERRVVIKAGVSQSSASKGTTKKFKVGGVEHKITTGKSLPQWLILKRNRPLFYEPVEGEEDLVDEADAHATMKLLKSIHNNWDLAVYVRVLSTKNPISPDMNIISGARVEILKSPSPVAGGKK